MDGNWVKKTAKVNSVHKWAKNFPLLRLSVYVSFDFGWNRWRYKKVLKKIHFVNLRVDMAVAVRYI